MFDIEAMVVRVATKAAEEVISDYANSPEFLRLIDCAILDVIRKAGEPRTAHQFILQMGVEIVSASSLSAREAMRRAREAYRTFTNENGVSFGNPSYGWSKADAKIVAHEYEICCW
jgi:hypothetical protein